MDMTQRKQLIVVGVLAAIAAIISVFAYFSTDTNDSETSTPTDLPADPDITDNPDVGEPVEEPVTGAMLRIENAVIQDGLIDLRPQPLTSWETDGTTLWVHFDSNNSCVVLASALVEETTETVTVTLTQGDDPNLGCLDVITPARFAVELEQPLNERSVLDGNNPDAGALPEWVMPNDTPEFPLGDELPAPSDNGSLVEG